MKKAVILIGVSVIALLIVGVNLFSGGGKDYSDYKNVKGYKEYVTETDSGYKNAPYYFCDEPMLTNKDALHYYKNNCRQVGDYYITNYLDGVCINRFVESENCKDIDELGHLTVPKEIDGLPVLKIGCYVDDNIFTPEIEVFPAFHRSTYSLTLPSSVKYISSSAFETLKYDFIGNVTYIDFDKDNPYYVSDKGNIYNKNMDTLLYFYNPHNEKSNLPDDVREVYYERILKLPETVKYFYPSNGVDRSYAKDVEFSKNIEEINAYFSQPKDLDEYEFEEGYEGGIYTVYGYTGTVAEKWAKDNELAFVALDKDK